jgi:16S rRNA (uracil1498-N3)-methyltransferase
MIADGILVTGLLVLDAAQSHYLVRVLRLRAGDPVQLFDGQGVVAEATIERADANRAQLKVGEPHRAERPDTTELAVAIALIKNSPMRWAVQKMTELGVAHIFPFSCERSVVRLEGSRAAERIDRYRQIAAASARQCGSAEVPEIHPIGALDQTISALSGRQKRIFLWENARGAGLGAALSGQSPASVALIVGPEGGFCQDEASQLAESGFEPVSLGRRILRAETAAVAATAVVQQLVGALGS